MQDLPVSSCWDRGRQYLSSSLNSLREKTSQISLPRQPLKTGALLLTLLLSNAKSVQAQNCFPPIPTQYAPLNQTFNVSFGNYLGPLTIREKGQAGLPSWLRTTNSSNLFMYMLTSDNSAGSFFNKINSFNSIFSIQKQLYIGYIHSAYLDEPGNNLYYLNNDPTDTICKTVVLNNLDTPILSNIGLSGSCTTITGNNNMLFISLRNATKVLVYIVDKNSQAILNIMDLGTGSYISSSSEKNDLIYFPIVSVDQKATVICGYNISNPYLPNLLSCNSVPLFMSKLFIENSTMYFLGTNTTSTTTKFMIFDIANPSTPTLLSSLSSNTPSDYSDFSVSNQKVYISSASDFSIKIVDISNLNSPVIINSLPVGMWPQNIIVLEKDLYCAFQYELRKFDISNPLNPIQTGSFSDLSLYDVRFLKGSTPTSYTIGLRGTPTTGNGTTTTIEIIGNGCRNEFNLTIGNPPLEAPKPITSTLSPSTNIPTGNDKEEFIYNLAGVFPSPFPLNYTIASNNDNPLQPWMQLRTDPAGPRIEGQYNGSNAGNYYVLITATDPNGLTGSAVLPIIIQGPPYFNGTVPNLYPTKQQNFVYILSGIVKDPNNDPLTFRFDNLPNWLKFNTDLKTFSGDVPFDAANATVTMYVTDGIFPSINAVFNITPGSAPVLNYPISDQVGRINKYFETHFPANSFTHPERLPLTYSAKDLPGFLSFFIDGNGMGQFNGTSPNPFKDIVTFMAQDPYNRTKMVSFLLNIKDNEAPQVIGSMPPIPPAKTGAKSRWEFNIKKIFRDSTEDPLEVSWILSNGNPLPPCFLIKPTGIADIFEIIATPSTMDLGGIANTNKIYEIILSVRDDLGASASTNIRIEVTGKSLLQTVASIGGPILSVAGLIIKLKRSEVAIRNMIAKMKGIPTSEVGVDLNEDNHAWPLKTPAADIESIEILYESGSPKRFPWDSALKPLPLQLSECLSFKIIDNSLNLSINSDRMPADINQLFIQAKKAKGVIAENFLLNIIPKKPEQSLITTSDEDEVSVVDMYEDNSSGKESYSSSYLS